MAIAIQYKCDQCKAEKKVANHWWVLTVSGYGSFFKIMPWSATNAEALSAIHICGQTCLTKRLSTWMHEQTQVPKTEAA